MTTPWENQPGPTPPVGPPERLAPGLRADPPTPPPHRPVANTRVRSSGRGWLVLAGLSVALALVTAGYLVTSVAR